MGSPCRWLALHLLVGSACAAAPPARREPPARDHAAGSPGSPVAPAPEPARAGRLDLTRELPIACLAWSASEATVACVLGGGSLQSGHTYELAFLGAAPASFPIATRPPLDGEDDPLVLPAESRAAVSTRLTAGGYVELPPPTGALTPTAPFIGDRFELRWDRRSTGRVDSGVGAWDVFVDTLKVGCGGSRSAYRTILTGTIENPSDDVADVHRLSPRHVLIQRRTAWGIEGDRGGERQAALVDLDALGC